MIVDPIAQALHHKHTLGGTLTAEEQQHLQRWYAQLDAEEEAMFARAREREGEPADLDALQAEIEETKAKIVAETKTIEVLEKQNEWLRQEIASLQQKIAQKESSQSV